MISRPTCGREPVTHHEALTLTRQLPVFRQTARDEGEPSLVEAYTRLDRAIKSQPWDGDLDDFRKLPVEAQFARVDIHGAAGSPPGLEPFFELSGGPW
jgi:hypothetical protein